MAQCKTAKFTWIYQDVARPRWSADTLAWNSTVTVNMLPLMIWSLFIHNKNGIGTISQHALTIKATQHSGAPHTWPKKVPKWRLLRRWLIESFHQEMTASGTTRLTTPTSTPAHSLKTSSGSHTFSSKTFVNSFLPSPPCFTSWSSSSAFDKYSYLKINLA